MRALVLEKNIPEVIDNIYDTLSLSENFLDYFKGLDEQTQKSTKEQLIDLLKNHDLKQISIHGNSKASITSNTYELIVEAIEACKDLRSIRLHNLNYASKADTKKLSDALKKHTELEDIFFRQTNLPYKNETLESLSNHKNLVSFHMASSNIDDADAKTIVQICKNNPKLEELWLAHNRISDNGAKAIATEVSNNKNITSLYLRNNPVTLSGQKEVIKILENTHQGLGIFRRAQSLQDEMQQIVQEEGIHKFIDLIIQRARENKYWCSEKKLLDEFKTNLYKTFVESTEFKSRSSKQAPYILEEIGEIGNASKLNEKQESFVKACAQILKDDYIKDIKHKNPVMQIAQMIWQLFASIFFKRDPHNNQWKGYQEITEEGEKYNYNDCGSFVSKLLKSRQEQQIQQPTRSC